MIKAYRFNNCTTPFKVCQHNLLTKRGGKKVTLSNCLNTAKYKKNAYTTEKLQIRLFTPLFVFII